MTQCLVCEQSFDQMHSINSRTRATPATRFRNDEHIQRRLREMNSPGANSNRPSARRSPIASDGRPMPRPATKASLAAKSMIDAQTSAEGKLEWRRAVRALQNQHIAPAGYHERECRCARTNHSGWSVSPETPNSSARQEPAGATERPELIELSAGQAAPDEPRCRRPRERGRSAHRSWVEIVMRISG